MKVPLFFVLLIPFVNSLVGYYHLPTPCDKDAHDDEDWYSTSMQLYTRTKAWISINAVVCYLRTKEMNYSSGEMHETLWYTPIPVEDCQQLNDTKIYNGIKLEDVGTSFFQFVQESSNFKNTVSYTTIMLKNITGYTDGTLFYDNQIGTNGIEFNDNSGVLNNKTYLWNSINHLCSFYEWSGNYSIYITTSKIINIEAPMLYYRLPESAICQNGMRIQQLSGDFAAVIDPNLLPVNSSEHPENNTLTPGTPDELANNASSSENLQKSKASLPAELLKLVCDEIETNLEELTKNLNENATSSLADILSLNISKATFVNLTTLEFEWTEDAQIPKKVKKETPIYLEPSPVGNVVQKILTHVGPVLSSLNSILHIDAIDYDPITKNRLAAIQSSPNTTESLQVLNQVADAAEEGVVKTLHGLQTAMFPGNL